MLCELARKKTFIFEFCIEEKTGSPYEFPRQTMYVTNNYWKAWLVKSQYEGTWMEILNRSTLVPKLMTSHLQPATKMIKVTAEFLSINKNVLTV